MLIQTKLGIQCKYFQMTQIWSDNLWNMFKWKPISSSRSNILLFVAVISLPGAVPKIQALPEANYSEV